jgi:hypothetical protein
VALFDGDEDDAFSRATTDASGAARLGRVPPGRSFRLEVYANDDRFAKLVLDSWSPADATLTMPPGLSLRGTVVDPHGAPVPGARVVLQRRGDPDTERERTDDRGRFQFDRLAAGDVELRVSLDGPEPPPDAPVVTATPGGGTVTITIDPGLILRAKVDGWGDRDNSVIVGCPWFVEDGEKPVLHAGSHRAGRLSFTGLPRGRTGTIVFGPLNGGFLAFRPGVATDAGEVTVSLVRGATLSGRIRLPDGVPDQAAEPRVWAEVIGVGVAGRYAGRGRWLVEGVPESTWTVKAKLQFDGREYTAETTARPGVPADLELR